MKALLRLVDLLQNQGSVFILAKAAQAVSPAARRAHVVQPKAIDVRLSLDGVELGSAADAFPHGPSVLPRAALEAA
jgi:hypothetical protein